MLVPVSMARGIPATLNPRNCPRNRAPRRKFDVSTPGARAWRGEHTLREVVRHHVSPWVSLTMSTITSGTRARVRLHPDCPGDGRRPHHPAEEDWRVEVTTVNNDGDHGASALVEGGVLGVGRYFHPDELEAIPEPP